MVERIVYRDETYTTAWIDHRVSDIITTGLEKREFKRKNANELKEFMIDAIQHKKESIIIFSQDVVPDTIFERNTADSTIRYYLDQGGKIVWMCDVPLWYKGKSNARELSDLTQEYYTHLTTFSTTNILGIIPLMSHTPTSVVKITQDGKIIGLKKSWSSHRPIIYPGTDIKILAKSRPLTSWAIYIPMEHIKMRTRWRIMNSPGSRIWRTISSLKKFHIDIPIYGSIGLEREDQNTRDQLNRFTWIIYQYEDFPCAWIKYFGEGAFIRIWDYPIREEFMTEDMIQELVNISEFKDNFLRNYTQYNYAP